MEEGDDFQATVLANTQEVNATIPGIEADLRNDPDYKKKRAENGVC